jgi:TetR/AcrR family transcriptional repressor of nem operon
MATGPATDPGLHAGTDGDSHPEAQSDAHPEAQSDAHPEGQSDAHPDPRRGTRSSRGEQARARLLDAAVTVIRARGLTGTSVDDLCARAGVSKGAFFHHFPSKEALAVAAAEHWSQTTGALFAAAPYHASTDPLEKIMGYLDLRAALVQGTPADYGCLAGTMVQEVFDTSPPVRDACGASILGHASTLAPDIEAALAAYRPDVDPAARSAHASSLAVHTQTVLQGAFVVSKAANDPTIVLEAIEHLRRYLRCVFTPTRSQP